MTFDTLLYNDVIIQKKNAYSKALSKASIFIIKQASYKIESYNYKIIENNLLINLKKNLTNNICRNKKKIYAFTEKRQGIR